MTSSKLRSSSLSLALVASLTFAFGTQGCAAETVDHDDVAADVAAPSTADIAEGQSAEEAMVLRTVAQGDPCKEIPSPVPADRGEQKSIAQKILAAVGIPLVMCAGLSVDPDLSKFIDAAAKICQTYSKPEEERRKIADKVKAAASAAKTNPCDGKAS